MEPRESYYYRNVILHGVLGLILLFGFLIADLFIDILNMWFFILIIPGRFLLSAFRWNSTPALTVYDDCLEFTSAPHQRLRFMSEERRIAAEAIHSMRHEEGGWWSDSYWVLECRDDEYYIPKGLIREPERDEVTRHLERLVTRS